MDATRTSEAAAQKNPMTTERRSGRELVVTRTFDAPARLVFEAWTTPELLMRWWVPKTFGLTFVSCDAEVRAGGKYRFVFSHPSFPEPKAFFGKYLEVVRPSRLVWTNEEAGDAGQVTTLTFEDKGGKTLLVMHDLYPTKEALDAAVEDGSTTGMCETLDQLTELLAATQRPS